MKPANFLPFVTLAVLQLSYVGANPTQLYGTLFARDGGGCETEKFVKCIVSLGELGGAISSCVNAATDLGKIGSSDFNATETALEGADCIVESAMQAVDLPEDCGGCLKGILESVEGGGGDS